VASARGVGVGVGTVAASSSSAAAGAGPRVANIGQAQLANASTERPQTKKGGVGVAMRTYGRLINKRAAFFSRAPPAQKATCAVRRLARLAASHQPANFQEEIRPRCTGERGSSRRKKCSTHPLGLLGATGTTTMEHSACAMQTHPAVSAAARSAPGAERKR